MKELWEVRPEKHREGLVMHTLGWPLGNQAGGGSFVYHLENNQVYVGFVVHLNYANPYLYPYMEFQRFKHHPMIADDAGGRQARRLWRAGDHRGRLAVDAEAGLPRRRAARLRGRHGQRAAHQGHPQRDAFGHPRGRGGACGDRRRARGRRAGRVRRGGARRADRAGPEAGAQRQADLVEVRAGRRAGAGRPRHVGRQCSA